MAEQSTITVSNLPIDGNSITASDGQAQAVNTIIAEFNKQVPVTKISQEQPWSSWTPTIVWTNGITSPTDVVRYVREGNVVFFSFERSGAAGGATTFLTVTLPVVARNLGSTRRAVGGGGQVSDTATFTYPVFAWIDNTGLLNLQWSTASAPTVLTYSGFYEAAI